MAGSARRALASLPGLDFLHDVLNLISGAAAVLIAPTRDPVFHGAAALMGLGEVMPRDWEWQSADTRHVQVWP